MSVNINTKLNQLMRNYISSTGHNSSGRLSKSISFNATYNNGKFDIGLKAKEYILYLDNGKFIDNFLGRTDVKKVIAEYIVEELMKD